MGIGDIASDVRTKILKIRDDLNIRGLSRDDLVVLRHDVAGPLSTLLRTLGFKMVTIKMGNLKSCSRVYDILTKGRGKGYDGNLMHPFTSLCPKNRKPGSYGYVSAAGSGITAIREAIQEFTEVKGRRPKTFLDIGSGKGGMLLTALIFGLEPTGVEYSRELIRASKELYSSYNLPTYKIKTINCDFFKWEPKRQYDIVYFFNPWTDPALWTQALMKIKNIFPEDQVLASFYNMPMTGFKGTKRRDVWINDKESLITTRY